MFALYFAVVLITFCNVPFVFAPSPSQELSRAATFPNIRCFDQYHRTPILAQTLQEQCAKRTYGGSSHDNAGAYGFFSQGHSAVFMSRGWPIRFEPGITEGYWTNPRMRFLCLQRCWSHLDPEMVPTFQKYTVVDKQLRDTWIFRAEDNRSAWKRKVPVPPGKGSLVVPAIELLEAKESRNWWQVQPEMPKSTFVSLHPDNRILCPSHPPQMPLLPAALAPPFQSVQEMCATALDGGNPNHNMGGICRPEMRNSPSFIYFEPNLTPSLNTIVNPDNAMFGRSAIVRAAQFYCFYACTCTGSPDPDAQRRAKGDLLVVPWMNEVAVAPKGDGMRVVSRGAGGLVEIFIRVTDHGQSSVQQCSDGSCREVSQDILAKILQIPTSSSTTSILPPPSGESLGTVPSASRICPASCQGSRTCTAECPICRVGKPRMEQVNVVDRSRNLVFDLSWCSKQNLRFEGGLFPRAEDAPCACNSTYVSSLCCETGIDGIVWEGPQMKIGKLSALTADNSSIVAS